MNAPQLIEVSLNGYHEYGFDGQWEEFLTEPLSEIVHCFTESPAPEIGLYRV